MLGEYRKLVKPLPDGHGSEWLTKLRFPLLPAYEHVLKCSHLFNTLDARGAISVTERVAVIARVRKIAVGVAEAWMDQQSADAAIEPAEAVQMSLPFLLEIGTEEIPDWMIPPALENLARRCLWKRLGGEFSARWTRHPGGWFSAPQVFRRSSRTK